MYKADPMRYSWFTNCDESYLLCNCVDKKNGVLITATVYCALNGSLCLRGVRAPLYVVSVQVQTQPMLHGTGTNQAAFKAQVTGFCLLFMIG